jgi:CO/xanthine dehydrogenase FAD-binding subunit
LRIRPVFFGIGDRPTLASHAARCLEQAADPMAGLAAAQQALSQDLSPQEDLQADADTRMQLARVLLKRGLTDLLAQGRG